jgi:acetolactate synthase-1/2/3 large subunit
VSPKKYSDQLVDWLIELGYTHCFFVAGGNIMHLLDSVRSRMTCVPVVHEVAAGIAAEYFNETASKAKAFALVTAGPGLTNIITAMAGAWLEHRDLLVIGGQVKSTDLATSGLRQRGIQEIVGTRIAHPVTKLSVQFTTPANESEFKSAVQLGSTPRKGPIFIEVCLDVQGAPPLTAELNPTTSSSRQGRSDSDVEAAVKRIQELLQASQRPVLALGAGVHRQLSRQLAPDLEALELPIVTTWHGADRISSRSPNYCGRFETWGQRAANLIINQADAVFFFGARLGLQETGFNWEEFAKSARVVQVEIDEAELSKGHPHVDVKICGDANHILPKVIESDIPKFEPWLKYCRDICDLLPLNDSLNETAEGFVSPYDFYLDLSQVSGCEDIWIPSSSGGANSVAIQALRQWGNQLVICDNGLASMGYGLSGAIGAAFSAHDKRIWLIEGDGGFAQNLQELATVAVNNLNIKLFIFANNGYGSIRTTQRNYFGGAYLGCDTNTGLGFPNWKLLADAYGIAYRQFPESGFSDEEFTNTLLQHGPIFVEVPIDPNQTYWPKITSFVTPEGSMKSNPLYDMTPKLPHHIHKQVTRYLNS